MMAIRESPWLTLASECHFDKKSAEKAPHISEIQKRMPLANLLPAIWVTDNYASQ